MRELCKHEGCIFSFGDGAHWSGVTDGTTWNGFDNVSVPEEIRDLIAARAEAAGDWTPEGVAELRGLPVVDGLVSLANGYATVVALCEHDGCTAMACGVAGGGAGAEVPYCAAHLPCACGAYLVADSEVVEVYDALPGEVREHRRGVCVEVLS